LPKRKESRIRDSKVIKQGGKERGRATYRSGSRRTDWNTSPLTGEERGDENDLS